MVFNGDCFAGNISIPIRVDNVTGSILRWSGSKAKQIPTLASLAPNDFGRYVEPFAGSAALFFKLQPAESILGDLNSQVIDVYRAIKTDPIALADLLASIPNTAEAYYALRGLDILKLTLLERAARLIFLMKGCFNGVYRTNKLGQFNVPIGSRLYASPSRHQLVDAAALLRNTRLVDGDFESTLLLTEPGDLVYLDPPYRRSGRFRGEYGADFDVKALDRLCQVAKALAAHGRKIIISFSDDEHLLKILKGWSVHRASVHRTVSAATAARKPVVELILTSF